ncbi:MAG: hypothetical protein Q7K29_03640 [Thermoleophilia bacterium]|nr:hypothetical protein [Thermoleophilia bacterium]
MNRNSNISKDLSAQTAGRHRVPSWRSVFMAVALVLVIGCVGKTPPAQAAETALSFDMHAYTDHEGPICKGDQVLVNVIVERHSAPGGYGDELAELAQPVTGVEVKGLVLNPDIGQITSPSTTGWTGEYRSAARFWFTAENYGETTIKFDGLVVTPGWFGTKWGGGAKYVGVLFPVKVSPCSYKVNTVSTWKAGMTSVGTMDGKMKSDEQGNFTGSAVVNWVASIVGGGGCGSASGIAPSTAELTGKLNENGQLVGRVNFGPTSASGFTWCYYYGGSSTDNFFTPDPLTIRGFSEGASVYTQSQAVTAKNGSFTGMATIVVIPDEDEATG